MAPDDTPLDNEKPLRRYSRRGFLVGGAALGGAVLWGSGQAADAAFSFPTDRPSLLGVIPPSTATGGTGNTGAATPSLRPSGSAGFTGFTVDTAFGQIASDASPLFRFRYR